MNEETDIILLAKEIDIEIKKVLNKYLFISQENCIELVLKEMINKTKGHINPKFLEFMIIHHKTPYIDKNMIYRI